jgi:alpha-L-fucosidase 2
MGEGDHAHAVLQGLIGPQRTYPNMFDACPPFQIDGNFGGSAAIIEMLLQSWGGELLVLPALPSAWPSGSIIGLKARGGLTVDMVWRRGQLDSLGLNGPPNARVRLRYQGKLVPIDLNANGRYTTRNL